MLKSCKYYCKIIFCILFFLLPSWQEAEGRTKDQTGRQVLLPENPRRVISLAPSITEIVFALGQGELLKGVTLYSDFPPESRKIYKIGSYIHPDIEKIMVLNPDLCIAIKDGNPKSAVDKLETLGIPVFAVDPKDLDTVIDATVKISKILNAKEAGKVLAARMHSRIQRIKALTSKKKLRPGVFFQIGVSPIVSAGTKTFINELIELSGGRNLAQGAVTYPRYSREQVLGLAPDIIIITSMARGAVFEKVKKEWESWPQIPAARNHQIFLVNSNLFDRPSPRLIDGLELLFEIIKSSETNGNKRN